jgi:hypothetical protein
MIEIRVKIGFLADCLDGSDSYSPRPEFGLAAIPTAGAMSLTD